MTRRQICAAWIASSLPIGAAAAQTANERALVTAVDKADIDLVQKLLLAGTSPGTRDERRRPVVLNATAGNLVEIARLLMAAGADVNAADTNADSAFLLAAAQGHVEILRLAIEYGADVRSLNRYGGTALIPACHHGHVEAVRVLLRTSIDVNHVNALGWTALLETVILGDGSERYQQITTMLLARGARADIADRDKVAPLAHARQRRQIEIVRLLEAAGAQ